MRPLGSGSAGGFRGARMPGHGTKRLLLLPLEIVVAALLLLDEIARPFYRPLIRRIVSLAIVTRIETAIRSLPAAVILVLLAVPFGIAEPLKLVGLYWIGTGRLSAGLAALALAHAASFLLVERVYHAGREKLLTIRWFAAVIGFIVRLRDSVLARLRATRLWAAALTLVGRTRVRLARLAGYPVTAVPGRARPEPDTHAPSREG